ncbi:MAG: Asp-tRNA(Asn)/Glu-tRNA(Gln) amidotransferase subunit GatB [Legionellales bacterium]|nr:Asp-tRNA(Asn)/Glu-tRNA(Gln) amidotransferase subunit GatB [Legionellales bacterium]
MNWQTVIGLEVHAQLKTNSKLFSSSPTAYGAPANTQTSFIDAGLPGVLPVLNQQAIHLAIRFGLAIQATIHDASFFERKNYFYPDLPKGYQISQFQRPIVGRGCLEIEGGKKVIIERAHLEEDAGKSFHEMQREDTGIDLNRAGIPLLEIVTAPCLSSAHEAITYLKTLHQLLRFLGICDGNMQEGSFRCDVNLSLRRTEHDPLGTRTELKNLNSFRFIEKAIQYEQGRQQDLLENGQFVRQETRLYHPNTNTTAFLRSKENENDYRYFPDPDLLPIQISETLMDDIRQHMPPLPAELKQRLKTIDHLTDLDIDFLLTTPGHITFYDEVKQQSRASTKVIVNWLKGTYTALLNDKCLTFENPPVSSTSLACLLNHLSEQKLPMNLAKNVFLNLVNSEASVEELIKATGFQAEGSSDEIEEIIHQIIKDYPEQAAEFRAGKEQLLGFFVGQVMKVSKGQFNPQEVHQILLRNL